MGRATENIVAGKGSECVAPYLAFTGDTGIFHRAIPVARPWRHGMVDGHGQILLGITQAVIVDTHVVGPDQMTYVLLRAVLATHRRPGRTRYRPRACIEGLGERRSTSGLDHYLEQPPDAALSRILAAHTRLMLYRMLAMLAVI